MPPRKSSPANIPPEDTYQSEPELLGTVPAGDQPLPSVSELNLKVQRHQEQLLDLRRQQEEIELQKKELEELSRKQREFDETRRDIVEKLTRGLVLLEREEYEVKRELEQIKIVRDSFAEHLGQTENLSPMDAPAGELPAELTRALARVDQAKVIYNQSRARLTALRQAEEGLAVDEELSPESPASDKSFGAMVREGFAYALPAALMLFGLLLIYLLLRH